MSIPNPQLDVRFISGYPRPPFLQKPFHAAALVPAIHDVLATSMDGR